MVDSVMELTDILKLLPHRYPILLVDRVLELIPGKRVVALKNVTANESFFQGHFLGYPVMPEDGTTETHRLRLQSDGPWIRTILF